MATDISNNGIYFKCIDDNTGHRYFKRVDDNTFIQVVIRKGTIKKGRANSVGIGIRSHSTIAANYTFRSSFVSCSKEEYDIAFSRIQKMLESGFVSDENQLKISEEMKKTIHEKMGFYRIWSLKHQAWFRDQARGYTDDLDQAGLFSPSNVETNRSYYDNKESTIALNEDDIASLTFKRTLDLGIGRNYLVIKTITERK